MFTDDIELLSTPKSSFTRYAFLTGKRKRVDLWSQRAGPQTPTRSAASSRTEPLPITYPWLHSPIMDALDNEDEGTTQTVWPETGDTNKASPSASTPPREEFSKTTQIMIHRHTCTIEIQWQISTFLVFLFLRSDGEGFLGLISKSISRLI